MEMVAATLQIIKPCALRQFGSLCRDNQKNQLSAFSKQELWESERGVGNGVGDE
jgi:hypothetical protein